MQYIVLFSHRTVQLPVKYMQYPVLPVTEHKEKENFVIFIAAHVYTMSSPRLWLLLEIDSRLTFCLPPPKKEVMFSVRSVCLSVCPSDYSQTCEQILTKFFGGVGHGSRTKWYNFGGDPDHASDPGVQSPNSGSAEVCSLWVHSCLIYFCVVIFADVV